MTAKEWLVRTFYDTGFLLRPRAKCKDGFSISIQANQFTYCTPRRLLDNGEYSYLELGYASEYEELLGEYQEGVIYQYHKEAIYPYVPMEVVEKVIEKHGGIVGEGERWTI